MKKNILSAILAIILIIPVMTSCGKKPEEGKSFTMPIDNDPVYLDPQIATDSGALSIINNCFEGLVRLDENGDIVPGVATDWSVSDDGLSYTFNLRKDAVWYVTKSAGKTIGEDYETSFSTALTADDFIFALRRAVAKTTNSENADKLLCIKNAEAIHAGNMSSSKLGVRKDGDYKLKIKLDYPSEDFLTVLTTAVAMPCNEKFFNITAGRYGLSSSYLIYNGPFYISNWNENTSVTIKKNLSYSGDNEAKPASVFFSVNSELDARAKKLSQGTYDFTPLSFEQYKSIENDRDVSFSESRNTLWGLIFNCSDADMSCRDLRLAICYGFDKSLMKKSEYMSEAAAGALPPSVMLSGGSYREKAGETGSLDYSAKKAGKYWEKALGKLEKDGMSITIKCTQEHENQLRAVLQNLQKIFGISCDARVSVVEEAELLKDICSGSYQIAYAPITASGGFAADFLESGVKAFSRYDSPEYDRLIKCVQKGDNQDRLKSLKQAEEHLISNAVLLPVFFADSFYGANADAQGIYISSADGAVCFINAIKN
ncbi:MAG: peptide ABC transporter substrate-binding protein [Acutalibacteraceae bacterium]